MTVMSNVKTHVFECKRVLLELGVNYMGATAEARKRLTISQSRRRTSSRVSSRSSNFKYTLIKVFLPFQMRHTIMD